ncbi:MAG: hypothetical protein VYE73_17250 [Acidobacteriota bacterium]|nr:hypothetical protein [Acidobacteriota bacterium]
MSQSTQLSSLAIGAAILALAIGCASAPAELNLPPQRLTAAPTDPASLGASPPPVAAAPSNPAALPPAEAPPPVDDEVAPRSKTIVIQTSAARAVTPESLFEAAQAERARRTALDADLIEKITNENLAEYAEGGQLTIAAPPKPPAESAITSRQLTEEQWRTRGLDLRLRWKEAVEAISELEGDAARLRRRFYDEDDPFYRDNEIKPAWDRAIERLETARTDVRLRQEALDDYLVEGRQAGALPGWLSEGVELEPPRVREDDDQADRRRGEDPREPKILNEQEIRN